MKKQLIIFYFILSFSSCQNSTNQNAKKTCNFYISHNSILCYNDRINDCENVVDLSNVTKLRFDDNDCNQIKIDDLNRLKIVDIVMHDKSYIPDFISDFPNLKFLGIVNSKIYSIPKDFFKLPNIEHLGLVDSPFDEDFFSKLYNFKQLKSLDLWHTNLKYFPKNLQSLRQLTVLEYHLTEEALTEILKLKNLEELSINLSVYDKIVAEKFLQEMEKQGVEVSVLL